MSNYISSHSKRSYSKTENLNSKHVLFNNIYEFPIIGCILGGIVAQEVVKITGKYIPLNQELLLDYSELYVKKDLYKSCNIKKYQCIYNYLSKPMIQYLTKLNIFLVGCGALGCEYLKLFSLLNIACHKKGTITVTDMDNIELSNLNRQFLFREDDIGKQKSFIASQKIKQFNPSINIQCYDKAVGYDNEPLFNRSFWEHQDIVVNALDNVQARQYVDNQCVLYKKPLLEAGTLGTKCNLQVIIPNITKSYSETMDPPEKSIPLCTIKQFPYKIEHCLEWSMEIFNQYFNIFIHDVEAFSKGQSYFLDYMDKIDNDHIYNNKITLLCLFKSCLENPTYINIVYFVKKIFKLIFINPIQNLLTNHPIDEIDDNGVLFWSGNRLPPNIIYIDKYSDFIKQFSIYLCKCLNIMVGIHIEINVDFNIEDSSIKNEFNINKLLNIEPNAFYKNKLFHYSTFDKDNQEDVIMMQSISNVRADTYRIPNISKIDCQLISGKIIPALHTTTSLITSLSIMELLKYVYNKVYNTNKKGHSTYKDYFINIGINQYISSQPQNSTKIISNRYNSIYGTNVKSIPDVFNYWDKIVLERKKHRILDITDTIAYLKDTYNMCIDMIICGEIILYNKFNNVNKNIKYSEIYSMLNKPKTEYLKLNISLLDKNSVPILTPKIVYSW